MRDPRGQRRVEVAALQSQQAEDAVEVAVRQRPHHRFDARERAACALGIPRYRDRDRARRRHEADRLVTRCPSPVGERDGRRDGRMTAEGHLGDGREGANAQRAVGFPPRDEPRLGVIHLGRDALHGRVVQTLRVEHDAGGIATLGARAERGVAEHLRRGEQLGDERLDPGTDPRVVHADEQDGGDAHAVRPIGMLPSICATIVIVHVIATMTANTTVPIQTQSGGHPPATVRRRSTTVRPIM